MNRCDDHLEIQAFGLVGRHDLNGVLRPAHADAAFVAPPVPVGQEVLQCAPALGHHFVHQFQHPLRVRGETVGPSEGFKAMAYEQRQWRCHQFPRAQIRRHGLEQGTCIHRTTLALFSVRSEVGRHRAVASQQLGFRSRTVNGTVVLSKGQRVGGVVRVKHRTQQGHHRQCHRVTAQVQALRRPRRDAAIHEVLGEGCAVLVAAQEHHDVGQRKMSRSVCGWDIPFGSSFIDQGSSGVGEDAFYHPRVALVLFADPFLLDQAGQVHIAFVLGRGRLPHIIVDALQGFGEVALNAPKPPVVPVNDG